MPLPASAPTMTPQEFTGIRNFIYSKTGIFFTESKQYFLENRLAARLTELSLRGFQDYLGYIQGPKGRDELRQLFIEITTNETSFWRNPPQIEAFQRQVLPDAVAMLRARGGSQLRIWSAACSSGEEPYTLAMVCAEAKDNLLRGLSVEILATDINDKVLAQAKDATYGTYTLRNLSPTQLKQHFLPSGPDNQQVKPELRAMVNLKNFNLVDYLNYRSLGTFDIIFCRNVLIYFDSTVKKKVLEGFHAQLHPKAYLLVGHSESIHSFSAGFELLHFSKAMGYRKRP